MNHRWTEPREPKTWTVVCGSLAAALALSLPVTHVHAKSPDDPLAPAGRWEGNTSGSASTPPMGWNSWNAFRTEVDEGKVMGAAQVLADSGLAKLGYTHVILDDGWWMKRKSSDGVAYCMAGLAAWVAL